MKLHAAILALATTASPAFPVRAKKSKAKSSEKSVMAIKSCDGQKCELDTSNFGISFGDSSLELELKPGRIMKCIQYAIGKDGGWKGSCTGQGTAIFIKNGKKENGEDLYFGSVVDTELDEICQISPNDNGACEVICRTSDEFPNEADPPQINLLPFAYDDEPIKISNNLGKNLAKNDEGDGVRKLYDDNGGNLDIMVVYTKKAECAQSGYSPGCTLTSQTKNNMLGLIYLAIEETNDAFEMSGVDTSLRLVHTYRDPSYVEASSDPFSAALDAITDPADGAMDDVHDKRAQYGADLVAMIIDDPQYCGIAWLGPNKARMFSVTAWNCATGYYSFGHEIAHNLGCNHDRGTSNECPQNPLEYQYGYRDPNAQFRSILAYNCRSGQCDKNAGGGCTRVNRFSNPTFLYEGRAIGSANEDNARRINDVRATVAAYYEAINCSTDSSCDDGDVCTEDVCLASGLCGHTNTCPTSAPTASPTARPRPTLSCISGKTTIEIEILSDKYGRETTWTLVNEYTSKEVLSGGPLSNENFYNTKECIEDGMYTFTIYDSWGDGICCGYGEGNYQVYYDGWLMTEGGAFSLEESSSFGSAPTSNKPSLRQSNSPSTSVSSVPSLMPSVAPSPPPSVEPSGEPTVASFMPSAELSFAPTRDHLSAAPSFKLSTQPSFEPSKEPTAPPSRVPSVGPSLIPSASPTDAPSFAPSIRRSSDPSSNPSGLPTVLPSFEPSFEASAKPSVVPSMLPSSPTPVPIISISVEPTLLSPSKTPSFAPDEPSSTGSSIPTRPPSLHPTSTPSRSPTTWTSQEPSHKPSTRPTTWPSQRPSPAVSSAPTGALSSNPSAPPSRYPSASPSSLPSFGPTTTPSSAPVAPTTPEPSMSPTLPPLTPAPNTPEPSMSSTLPPVTPAPTTHEPSMSPTLPPVTPAPTTPEPSMPPTLPPVTPAPNPPAPLFCFSTSSSVDVKDRGHISITDLRLNDQVRTDVGTYSKVYAFGNRNLDRPAVFTRIVTPFSTIELTPDHMIFLEDAPLPVAAGNIQVGDRLKSGTAQNYPNLTTVIEVQYAYSDGFITPLTTDGKIVVDGVVASNYAGKAGSEFYRSAGGWSDIHYHLISHVAVAPVRFLCTRWSSAFCDEAYHYAEESHEHPGKHLYIAAVHSLKHFVKSDECGPVLHFALFSLVIGTGMVFCFLESGYGVATLVMMASIAWWKRRRAAHHEQLFRKM